MPNVAFLGTGLLGSAFAEAAAKRGDTVTAWNRSPERVLALARFGIKSATTPAAAVRGASRVGYVSLCCNRNIAPKVATEPIEPPVWTFASTVFQRWQEVQSRAAQPITCQFEHGFRVTLDGPGGNHDDATASSEDRRRKLREPARRGGDCAIDI